MSMLLLVRNFVPAHEMVKRGEWQVSDIARNAFDLEGKTIGTIGAGRIGYRVLQRLVPFDPKQLLYFDYQSLPSGVYSPRSSRTCDLRVYDITAAEKAVNARRVEDLKVYSTIVIHCGRS